MKYQLSLSFFFFVSFLSWLHAQEAPKSIVHQPLGITQYTSGTFAEPRNNHLHSGTDIRTDGKEGLSVYAVNDGFVSRIRVSSTGFGHALYINHPDGTTSVYAHLQGFNDTLAKWTEKEQYRLRKFEVDLFPKAGALKVTAGEEIARSGNTGSSGGPHLHFELRSTKTEEIMNPQEHGLIIADAREPELRAIWVYPLWRLGALGLRATKLSCAGSLALVADSHCAAPERPLCRSPRK